jgi:hypothetical protein
MFSRLWTKKSQGLPNCNNPAGNFLPVLGAWVGLTVMICPEVCLLAKHMRSTLGNLAFLAVKTISFAHFWRSGILLFGSLQLCGWENLLWALGSQSPAFGS